MILTSFIAASLSLAQPTVQPSRLDPPGRPAEINMGARNAETEAQRVLGDYATCVVRRERRSVETYLAAPVATPEAEQLGNRLIQYQDCLAEGTLRFQAQLFRGLLYDALYKRDHAGRTSADFTAVPRIVYVPGATETLTPEQRDWRSLNGFADCVVRAAPAEARQLILANITSPQERAVFGQLGPYLGPCLPEGIALRFGRPVLRGLIAESLYRLTMASLNAPPAPAAAR